MKIDGLILGSYQTNSYILREDESAEDCLIVDTGLEAGGLIEFLSEHKLNPAAVALTHGHADHIRGVALLREKFPGIKVYIHRLDTEMLTGAVSNLSLMEGIRFSTEPADFVLEEGDVVEQAGIKLKVLHTPGHTPGGICLYSEDDGVVFSGDTLFCAGIGRTDFPGGSMTRLLKSIREKLFVLPDETVVYPGHGPVTTITQEKANNPYLQ
ncbi:MAG: MBL fold metallo-hydrolase [Planctomycetota bacterium]|jgi:glyoxylase-like metal-dependent hydrolase (beta-lactamase superfamily II)